MYMYVCMYVDLAKLSLEKGRKKIVTETVLNVSGKLYTNVLNHTITRKNNIVIIL